jgi:hypothetical protein
MLCFVLLFRREKPRVSEGIVDNISRAGTKITRFIDMSTGDVDNNA